MTNKYLEKIAVLVPALVGAVSAREGDRAGGAVSGVLGGGVGAVGGAMAGVVGAAKKHGISLSDVANKRHAAKLGPLARAGSHVGAVGGAYLAGKAYSAFKHRNDYNY